MEAEQLSDFIDTPSIQEKLLSFGTERSFLAGAVILNEHAYIRSIPIVLRGSIRVMRSDEEGRELFLYYIPPGESCIMSLLGGLHHDTSKVKAVAEEDTDVLFVPVDQVYLMIKENPKWLDYIFRLYHKRFEELLEVVNAVAFKRMDERILDLIRKKTALSQNQTIPITHESLAGELGTSRVVVSRLLKQMEAEGMVKLGRNKITLC